MKFYFPDSQDLVDPGFDFEKERWSTNRVRQRDDLYAHEIFRKPAFDGLLVSKGIVDGVTTAADEQKAGRYTRGQRQRLLLAGVREFFRLDAAPYPLPVIGDCGAFTYVGEKVPPYSVDEVIEFYTDCRFDFGISVDHVILDFHAAWDVDQSLVPNAIRERQDITLALASEFLRRHKKSKLRFKPIGVAQGWSPKSYAKSVTALQKMGYDYIAIGGMVPLKTKDILMSLEGVAAVRKPKTRLHLLGVTRTEAVSRFADFGVESFDSTSPLRQAFKDDRDNYYTADRTYTAIRIPQVGANATLKKLISSGAVDQGTARTLELACLKAMRDFDKGKISAKRAVKVLLEYDALSRPHKTESKLSKRRGRSVDNQALYMEVLTAAPWRRCQCEICRALGYHVILFRGAERNRRRGFHNLFVFYRRLQRQLRPSARRSQ